MTNCKLKITSLFPLPNTFQTRICGVWSKNPTENRSLPEINIVCGNCCICM